MKSQRKTFSAFSILALLALTPSVSAEGDSAAGKIKSAQCAGCHEIPGLKSVFPEVYPIPRIMNQSSLYIEYALREYRSGTRSHPSMTGMAGTLSDEDIADLAAYYGSHSEQQ